MFLLPTPFIPTVPSHPKNTGVGKTESIYDADYRVIIPPYQPPSTNPRDNDTDDDWDFLTDEE